MAVLTPSDIRRILKNDRNSMPVDDFRLIDSWAEYDDGKNENERPLNYLCYEIEVINPETGETQHLYKALKFLRIRRLPKDAKQSTAFMDMQQQVLTSVYENSYNLVTVIANIINPVPLGLLFLYGVQGVGHDLEDAKAKADKDFVGLCSLLQGTYRVLHFQKIKAQETEWLREKMYSMDYLTMTRGIPKASKTGENAGNKGMGNKNLNPDSQGTLEEFIAGMVDYEYVIQVLATPVFMKTLTAWQTQTQLDMTEWNSQLQGTKSFSANLSIPMMYMANTGQSQGWSQGYTDAESISYSSGESFTQGYGESVGQSLSHTIGQTFGQSQGVSVSDSVSQNDSVSVGNNIGFSTSHGQSLGVSENTGTSFGTAHSVGTSESLSQSTSDSYGTSQNFGQSISKGQSMGQSVGSTIGESISQGHSVSHGGSVGTSQNVGSSTGHSSSVGTSDSIGWSEGQSSSQSQGGSSSQSTGSSSSSSHGSSSGSSSNMGSSVNVGTGTNHSVGTNSSTNESTSGSVSGGASGGIPGIINVNGSISAGHSEGSSDGTSENWGTSTNTSTGQNVGFGTNNSTNDSTSQSQSQSQSSGQSWGNSSSQSSGQSGSHGSNQSFGSNSSVSQSASVNQGLSNSESFNVGSSQSLSNSVTNSLTNSLTNGFSESAGVSHSKGSTSGMSMGSSVSDSVNQSVSTSKGQSASNSVSESQNVGQSQSQSIGTSQGHSVGRTQSTSASQSESTGTSSSASQSSNVSTGRSTSKGTSTSTGQSIGSSGTITSGASGSMGLGPSIGYNKSYQWLDQQVKDILELLEFQNERIKNALRGNGAFYTYTYIACPSLDALSAAQALAKSTWNNENAMIQPLQVMYLDEEEQKHLLYHFSAFSTDITRTSNFGVSEYKYSTVLLSEELVAYTHLPRISEGGIFAEVNDVPKFAVPSMMKGEIYMGSILSSERYSMEHGYVTPYDYRIAENELMHGFFTGASRSGKTVAAMRFVAELSRIRRSKTGKRLRIVCMDPKQDWRGLARFVEPERFRFYSMGNPNFHPIHFNPCKIPRGVIPQIWVDVMIEIYCRAYGLLERGKQLMAETFYSLYEEQGVFDAYGEEGWEEKVSALSANVTFSAAYERMSMYKQQMDDGTSSKGRGGNDTKDAYARLLERLSAFARPYSIERRLFGESTGLGVDELIGDDDVTVLESKGLESTFRSFIFGVITAGFYRYAISQENGFLAPDQYETVLIIEEANEVLTGSDTAGTGNSQMGLSGQSEFEQILDQSAGYGLFIFAITQKIADMPKSVIANSGIRFIGKIQTEDDINVAVKTIAKDPRFDDRDVAKWFPRSPTGWFVCQSSRTFNFTDIEPVLVQIAMLNNSKPTNSEIDEMLAERDARLALKKAAEEAASVPAGV